MRFDVIGDIHGEFDKLTSLLGVLVIPSLAAFGVTRNVPPYLSVI